MHKEAPYWRVNVHVCLCVHETAEPLDGVATQSDTQTSQQTVMNERTRPIKNNHKGSMLNIGHV